jgi:hypothetical protein
VNFGLKQGYLTYADFMRFYTSPVSIKQAIARFLAFGIMKQTDTSRFEIDREIIEIEIQRNRTLI